jgi:hypothetical protein
MYNLRRHLKAVHGADTILPPVRRVQPLDQPTKAPVSKTDLLNPKLIAEKKEKVPKPRRVVCYNNVLFVVDLTGCVGCPRSLALMYISSFH